MAKEVSNSAAQEMSAERKMLKRSLMLLPLCGIIYLTIGGGTFGIESAVKEAPRGYGR
jgi:hypothetical protein